MPDRIHGGVLAAVALAAIFASAGLQADEIETDHLFSFNVGSDVDEPGTKEVAASFDARFGRAAGRYLATEGDLSIQYVPIRNLEIGLAGGFAAHRIAGVPGLDDRNRDDFSGLSLEAKYRLIEREPGGFGLALSAQPAWSRVDEESGEPVDGFGADLVLAMDKELVPGALVGMLNVVYAPETARSRVDRAWSREATLGLTGGLMQRVTGGVFAGIEARYLRRYEALDLSGSSGQALYLGPNLVWNITERSWISAGWNAQLWGRGVEASGALDLEHFARNEVRFAAGLQF